MSAARPLRLGCLVSGGGRSVLNLQDRIERGELPATIVTVLSTRTGVPAIERARARGLPTREIDPLPRESLDDRVDQALREVNVDLVVLAGYLRLFRVDAWRGRCINIHPALLPRHGGKGLWGHHVHEAVLAAGDVESGCTVHWVDAEYDHGATILQRRCPVLPGDSPDTLATRVFAEELEALPEAIQRIARGVASPVPATG
jgi:formyltetrahydrofolate-dependent phosphoribosylglycinamide formyltransferase